MTYLYLEPLRARVDSYFQHLSVTPLRIVGIYNRSFSAIPMAGKQELPPALPEEHGPLPAKTPLVINFHTDAHALHPLSVLIPPEVLETVDMADAVSLERDAVVLGDTVRTLASDLHSPRNDLEFWSITPDTQATMRRIIRTLGRFSEMGRAVFSQSSEAYPELQDLLTHATNIGGEHLLPFVGTGEGSTPSGDDLLAGYLLVDRHLPHSIVRLDGSFWEQARARTTPIALWQLYFAAAGQSSLAFEHLGVKAALGTLAAADVVKCLGYGFSSGTDLLCGMLARWQREIRETPTERKE